MLKNKKNCILKFFLFLVISLNSNNIENVNSLEISKNLISNNSKV